MWSHVQRLRPQRRADQRVMRKHQAANDELRTTSTGIDAAIHKVAPVSGTRSSPLAQERLPQRPGVAARSDRHHRLHDGLRHHRHRARLLAGQVQEAGRRRSMQIVNNTVVVR